MLAWLDVSITRTLLIWKAKGTTVVPKEYKSLDSIGTASETQVTSEV